VTDALCREGSTGAIDLTPTGGTPPYTYAWSNDATSEDVTGLAAGSYSVTVTDAHGCTASASFTVAQPAAALDASGVVSDVPCHGAATGAIDLTVTGGTAPYTYSWSNGATTEDVGDLVVGAYGVTVTDAHACTTSASFTVAQPAEALGASGVVTGVPCHGAATGAIDLTVSGGTPPYAYAWSNGATSEDVAGLVAGSYSVTVTDAHACTMSTSFTVTQPIASLAAEGAVTEVACSGGATGAIDLGVTGGTPPYAYAWSNGATSEDVTGLPVGAYDVTVTDASGCTT
jgi:hypothetical protein